MNTPKLQILGSLGAKVDKTFSIDGQAADAKMTGERLRDIESKVADLLYEPIAFELFYNNIGTKEIGSYVETVHLEWMLNKTPTTLTLDGETIQHNLLSYSLTGLNLTKNTTFTIKATDERGATATKTTSITFLNGVYYGVSETPETLDSAFILTLSKTLRSNKLPSFKANAGAGQYIYYCIPTRFGTCTFTVGGFTGGFSLVGTIAFTNASGYTEAYYVYRSDNANLGSTDVTVG